MLAKLFDFTGNHLTNRVTHGEDSVFGIESELANVTVKCKQNCAGSGTIFNNTKINVTNRYNFYLENESDDKEAQLLDATVDFKVFGDGFESIDIVFYESIGDDPNCVYWNEDEDNPEWSSEGCRLVDREGNSTICQCDHLTNFGLIFGYGSEDCGNDNTKEKLSQILGGISIALLAFTQLYLHLGK